MVKIVIQLNENVFVEATTVNRNTGCNPGPWKVKAKDCHK